MSLPLRVQTKVMVFPPNYTGTVEHQGVGYEWMVRPEEASTPTNTARGIFHTYWYMGKGTPKLYYVPEPVPFVQVLHTHQQIKTFTDPAGRPVLLYDAPVRLAGQPVTDFNTSLGDHGFLFRGAATRWGLVDIPCISSGPFGSGITTLGATVQAVENFTLRVLPVLEYQQGSWSLRVNFNQKHFFWWAQQPGSRNGESYFGFHRYTDYDTDQSKQIIPAGHLPVRAAGNWLQFNFIAFGKDVLLVEILDADGKALRRFMAYDPELNLYGKDVEVELAVNDGTLALGVTEHRYSATGVPPSSVPDEDELNDPDALDDDLALTYPLHAGVEVLNPNAPTGTAIGVAPEGTSFRVYTQRRAGSDVYRPVVALRSTQTRTPVLVGAQLVWPSTLLPGTGTGTALTQLRSAPVAYYSKDYRHNRLRLDYAVSSQPHLKGNECIEVSLQTVRQDGTIEDEQHFFGGFVSLYGTRRAGSDRETVAHLEARDWTLRLAKKDMGDTPCFAGWPLLDAVRFIFRRCGISDNLIHWEQTGEGWMVPQRALFKLEFKFDETTTALEALDSLFASCGFTWGTGFDGHIYIWSRAADYVDYGAVIDDTDFDDTHKLLRMETSRDLDDFANEVLVVTSPLLDTSEPTTARVRNQASQQDEESDLYVGEPWVKAVSLHDSYRAPLMAALELSQHTRERRLCTFTPRHGRLDILPRHIVTAQVSGHEFPRGSQFAVLGATYSVPVVGGLPRLRSEFVAAQV